MGTKVKLKRMVLKGFRGARKEIWLDFEDDNKSIVLFGNNGNGKSSFSDALEWFFSDRIDYLQREGCGREDYFNRYMSPEEDATIKINFNKNLLDSQKTLKRKGGYSFSNVAADIKDYLRDSSKESFILRHHTMREFIDKTKKEKLERVEEIIGFGIVKEIRDTLVKTLNALKDDRQLASLRGQLDERKRDLITAISKVEFQNIDILNYADQLAKQCEPSLFITDDSNFKSAIETLNKKFKASDRGKELLKLDDINENLSKLTEIEIVLQEVSNILTRHNDLAEQQETIKASAIEILYSAAIEAMKKELVETGKCPICKKPVDTEFLLKSLTNEIEEIKKVLKERNQVIQNAKSLSSKISPFQNNLKVLLEDGDVKTRFLTSKTSKRFTAIATLLSNYGEILNGVQKSPNALSLPAFLDLQNLKEEVKEIQQRIAQRKKELSETDEEKKYYQNVHNLKKLYDDYIRYNDINKLIGIYDRQIDSLEIIYKDFESMERESVQKVLKVISSDVNDFFRLLHPDDNFDEVELIPTEGRGIEFKLKYHGEEISPQ